MPRPFRADQVGSLLRPPELLRTRERFKNGALSAEALREQEDAAVLTALDRQRDIGLEIFTDGEFRRRSEMLRDVVRIIRDEVQALIQDGVDYVQLDAPFYGVFIDEQHRATLQQSGVDPDKALHEVVAADNAAIEGLPRDNVTLALHICRGNSRSRWLYEGGYNPIAEVLFSTLGVDTFLLEYDSERMGGFEPLRYLPAGKTAVLGLVTSKEPGLEPYDQLRRRIDAAAQVVPLEQIALSPPCGFTYV